MTQGLRIGIWNFSTALLEALTRNETLRQFLALPLANQKALLESLAAQNQISTLEVSKEGPLHKNWLYSWQGIRRYFQLPCALKTRHARADWIEKTLSKEARIVVLGDDDYLSVELSQRSFQTVEVADCDAKIIDSVRNLTQRNKYQPRCFEGTFFDQTFLNHRSPDLICIDPPYNLRWAKVFIEQALRTAGQKPDVFILLMINQRCFRKEDLQQISQIFKDAGFQLKQSVEAFNSYPLQGFSRFFLNLALRLLTNTKSLKTIEFKSDLLVYARGAYMESTSDLSGQYPKKLGSA